VTNFFLLQLGQHYGYSTLITGICYLPFGVCSVIGSILGGLTSDYFFKKGRRREARLVSCLIGFTGAVPFSIVRKNNNNNITELIIIS
jgi:sugar phosphate permease